MNPLYFTYNTPSGNSYTFLDGNGRDSGYAEPQLYPDTLHPGQQTHRYVVFDVPKGTPGADVQLHVGNASFQWHL